MITIDGADYDVPVTSLKIKGEFLDKYAERTESGVLHRELIGVYFNYEIQFGREASISEIAALWQKLTEPEEFHTVTVPDEDGDFTFTAYFANVSMNLSKDNGGANKFWKDMTANFIAKSPARTP